MKKTHAAKFPGHCAFPLLISFLLLGAFFASSSFALDPISIGSILQSQVKATVTVENKSLASADDSLHVQLLAINPTSKPADLYLMHVDGTLLVPVRELLTVESEQDTAANFDLVLHYSANSQNYSNYALISADPSGNETFVTYFTVNQDWSPYVASIDQYVTSSYNLAVPAFVALFIVVSILIFIFVRTHGRETENHGEFTMKSLILPMFSSKSTLAEKLSVIFINPVMWFDELLFMLVLLLIISSSLVETYGRQNSLYILILSGIGAALLPAIYLIGAYLLDFRLAHKPFRFFLAFFFWGVFSAVLAFFVTSLYASGLDIAGIGAAGATGFLVAGVISPVVEEGIKGFGIYIGSRHHAVDNALSGMLLGFATGLGFSFVENWFYFTSRSSPFELGFAGWLSFIVYRSFFNSVAHGIFCSAIGGFLGYLKSHPAFSKNYHVGIWPGLIAAIILHSIFNSSAILDSLAISDLNFPFFIFNPLITVLFDVAFVALLLLAARDLAKSRKTAGLAGV